MATNATSVVPTVAQVTEKVMRHRWSVNMTMGLLQALKDNSRLSLVGFGRASPVWAAAMPTLRKISQENFERLPSIAESYIKFRNMRAMVSRFKSGRLLATESPAKPFFYEDVVWLLQHRPELIAAETGVCATAEMDRETTAETDTNDGEEGDESGRMPDEDSPEPTASNDQERFELLRGLFDDARSERLLFERTVADLLGPIDDPFVRCVAEDLRSNSAKFERLAKRLFDGLARLPPT